MVDHVGHGGGVVEELFRRHRVLVVLQCVDEGPSGVVDGCLDGLPCGFDGGRNLGCGWLVATCGKLVHRIPGGGAEALAGGEAIHDEGLRLGGQLQAEDVDGGRVVPDGRDSERVDPFAQQT